MEKFSNSSIKAIFTDHFNGIANFMTPEIIGHGYVKRYFDRSLVWELSEGSGFRSGSRIFGVTVLEISDSGGVRSHRHDLSDGGFLSEEAARDYIKELKIIDLGKLE